MPTNKEVMQQALDAMLNFPNEISDEMFEAMKVLKARLAQPEPEELGEIIPADEEQLKRIAKLVGQEPVAQVQVAEDYHAHVVWTEGVNPVDLDQKYLYVAPSQSEQGCAECGKKAADGWALYCVKCSEPMREWVGLTDEEIKSAASLGIYEKPLIDFARAIEAKLKEKNT